MLERREKYVGSKAFWVAETEGEKVRKREGEEVENGGFFSRGFGGKWPFH